MSNINLNIRVSDNSNLFNILDNIKNTLIKPEYKSTIYKKHSGLINGCNKCWLNSAIQMIGYIDDIVQQIVNINPSGDQIKINIQKLFTDLINGVGDKSGNINYGTDFDPTQDNGYGNLYWYFTNILMEKQSSGRFEDARDGLSTLLNFFFQYNSTFNTINDSSLEINNYNIMHKNITNIKCVNNPDYKKEPTIISDYIYILNIPDNKIDLNTYINNILSIDHLIDDPDNFLNGCNTPQDKTKGPYYKKFDIKANKYLIFWLKLFSQNIINGKVINEKRPPNLNISKEITINNNRYFLSGFILHLGDSINGYHYVFYKVLPDGSGILYNDSSVSEITSADIDKLLTKNIVKKTPYVLLYEKREFCGEIYKLNFDIKKYDKNNQEIFYKKNHMINDKFDCYSKNIKHIYENFTFNEFVFDNNTLYYKINILEQNKQNLDLLKNILCEHLFINKTDYILIQKDTDNILIKILEFQQSISQQDKDTILAISNSLFLSKTELETLDNFNFFIL